MTPASCSASTTTSRAASSKVRWRGAGAAFFFFQFVFCAVSLAIVWGSTLERIKFIAYPIYAVVFSALIYPLIAHWIFGGGILSTVGNGVQDFAGSTVVHLTGATGALAAVLLLGPRKGKYGPDGKPRAIPGHIMPLFGLGVLILWLGWFGFNPGSTLGTADGRFAEVVVVTNLAAGRRRHRRRADRLLQDEHARRRHVRQRRDRRARRHHRALGLRRVLGRADHRRRRRRPRACSCVYAIDKVLDDPVGALSAHGLAGIWGTLSCGLFTSPRLAEYNGDRRAGPRLQRLVHAARRAGRRRRPRRS